MNQKAKTISLLLFAMTLTGSAYAADGASVKDQGLTNYCHMTFPAIRPSTLASDQPTLKSPTTGDVIDFYGACDESPTGPDQVSEQRFDASRHLSDDYNE